MVKVRRAAGARLETSSLNVVEEPALETGVIATEVPCPKGPSGSRGWEPAACCLRCKEGERNPIKKHTPIYIWGN